MPSARVANPANVKRGKWVVDCHRSRRVRCLLVLRWHCGAPLVGGESRRVPVGERWRRGSCAESRKASLSAVGNDGEAVGRAFDHLQTGAVCGTLADRRHPVTKVAWTLARISTRPSWAIRATKAPVDPLHDSCCNRSVPSRGRVVIEDAGFGPDPQGPRPAATTVIHWLVHRCILGWGEWLEQVEYDLYLGIVQG